MGYEDIKTYSSVAVDEMFFVQVDKNTVLFSDGHNGLWCYPGHGDAYRVQDLVPFLPDNNSGAGIAISECQYMLSGHYLTYHKGRVFMVKPNSSTVYYSGTRTDYDRNDGPPDTPIKPWELWNVGLDLSRANVGHGANMIVGKPTEKIRGIADTEEGLWVFKDNQILLWTWPDSAAPHESTQGAAIQEVSANTGLVSYRTIVKDKGSIYFLGMIENGIYKLFVMNSGQITPITTLVDNVMSRIAVKDTAVGTMHGNYYILFADTGSGVVPFICVNINTGAVVEFDGDAISAATVFDSYGKVVLGSGSTLMQFPGSDPIDTGGTYWRIEAHRVDAGKPFHGNKFRKYWSNIDTMLGEGIVTRDEDLNVDFVFDEDTEAYTDTVSGRDIAVVNLQKRSNGAEIAMYGTANGKIRINNVGIAVRDRKAI